MLEVADNGPGVPEDALAHIFDPFFTTKEVGKGTGLGLSISHTIIEKHGGTLQARNDALTGGAVFAITLPLLTAQTGKQDEAGDTLADLPKAA